MVARPSGDLAQEPLQRGSGTVLGAYDTEQAVGGLGYAVRSALSHKATREEALAICKQKVQEGTDRAWEAVDSM
jgi:hypothetical protein